ncbi:hypothetical protein QLQ15_00235 [Lysobacter sp. LF1]|uniref:Sulfotransferase family protein n=1 Tax=Lysobacter stagni TaxID=3045172 RepID=A0ABT6XB18_9GAMM|nr:hypothetical protein [Lysobacter sp. LF1]MDI9237339.1 hypothetical protein [Lysobacter sp. LF1]
MAEPDLADPRWFPADYDAGSGRFRFVHVELSDLGDAPFLDRRLAIDWAHGFDVAVRDLPDHVDAHASFLFHTAFCGSTLLARALHAPPRAVSLKEPLALHALAMARLKARTAQELGEVAAALPRYLALVSRPWAEGGRVLIKPANQANGLLDSILSAQPRARAVLLYSSLRSFMVSCFKKLPDSEQRIRWMAQALLRDTQLSRRLGIEPGGAFNLVESCALAWYAQMERYALALDADTDDRLRTLDFDEVLAAPSDRVRDCAGWLQLADEGLDERVPRVFSRHSKGSSAAYDSEERDRENARVLDAFGETIDRAVDWAEGSIGPAALMPRWKPLHSG